MREKPGLVSAIILTTLATLVALPVYGAYAVPNLPATSTVTVGNYAPHTGTNQPAPSLVPAEDYSHKIVSADSRTGQLLPLNRWAGTMGGFHTRRNFSITQPFESFQLAIGGLLMGGSNTLWVLAASLVATAATADMTTAGSAKLDRIAATIGEGVIGSAGGASIAVLFIVFVLGASLWTARREGIMPVVRQIGTRLLVIALIVMFVTGSRASTGGGTTRSAYHPGKFSPAWVTRQIDDAIGTVASAITEAPLKAVMAQQKRETKNDPLSCQAMINAMRKDYMSKTGQAGQVGAAMPLAMSMIWESVGPKAWSLVQFGASPEVQPYSERSWCHVVEMMSNHPRSEHVRLLNRAGAKGARADAMAFDDSNNTKIDIAAVGWAACTMRGGGSFDPGHVTTSSGTKQNPAYFSNTCAGLLGNCNLPKACQEWWNPPSLLQKAETAVKNMPVIGWVANFLDPTADAKFDWWDDNGKIKKEVKDPGAAEYIISLHGAGNPGVPVAAGLTYFFSGLCVFITFALLALAIIASKLILFIMGVAIFFLLAATLIPSVNTGEKLKQLAKAWLSFSMISAIALTLMAMLLIMTQAIITMGETMLAGSGIFLILWVGMSPMLAILAVNFLFKKVFKLPNMFTPKGALAWAGSVAGVGGAALAGSGMASRALSRGLRSLERHAQAKAFGKAVSGSHTGKSGSSGGADSLTVGSKAKAKPTVAGGSPNFNIDGAKGSGKIGLDGARLEGSPKLSLQGADVSGSVNLDGASVKSGSVGEARAASADISGRVGARSGEAGSLKAGTVNVGAEAGLLAAPASVPVSASEPVFGRGAVASRLSGVIEEQKMLAEMHPNSNMAVFMKDMATVKEKAARGREILSERGVEGVRDSLRAVVAAQPAGAGRKFVVGAKTAGKVALAGADRFARLPSVAVSGVRAVGTVGLGVAGAGAKAAAATVAGSLIPGVGMFAGPAMGMSSLRKSMSRMSDSLRERSVRVRGEHAAWLEDHGLGVVGVPDARRVDEGSAGGVGSEAEENPGGNNTAKQSMDSPDVKKETSQETTPVASEPNTRPEPVSEEKTPDINTLAEEKPRNVNVPPRENTPDANTVVREKTGTVSHDGSSFTAAVSGLLADAADTHQEKQQQDNAQIQAHMEEIAAKNSGKTDTGKPQARTLAEAMTGVAQPATDTTDQTLRRQQTEIENTKQTLANQKTEIENDARRLAQETQTVASQAQDAPPVAAPPVAATPAPQAPVVETVPVAVPVTQAPVPPPPTVSAPQPPAAPAPQPPTIPTMQPPNLPLAAQPEPPRFMSRRSRHRSEDNPVKGTGEKTSKPQA